MKILKLALLFLIICNFLYAQDSFEVKRGRINTTLGKIIVFKNLSVQENDFLFHKPGQSGSFSILKDEVLKIEKNDGNKAVLFGLVMGASGFLGAYLGSAMAESRLNSQGMTINKERQKNTILICGGISTLIGVIWGANVHKYKTVYNNPKFSFLNPERLYYSISYGQTSQLSIRYNF